MDQHFCFTLKPARITGNTPNSHHKDSDLPSQLNYLIIKVKTFSQREKKSAIFLKIPTSKK